MEKIININKKYLLISIGILAALILVFLIWILPLISAQSISTKYNFTDTTNNKAFNGTGQNANMFQGAEATSGTYTNLATRNSAYAVVTSGANNNEPFWRFNFTINEVIADINSVYVEFTGFRTSSGEQATIYVYNFTSTAFVSIGTVPATNGNVTKNFTTGFSNIINSGNKQLVIAVQGLDYDSGERISVDFVQVTVGSEVPPEDSCTCAGLNQNWLIDMADGCNITTTCDLGTGIINWIGTGTTLFNATINASRMVYPSTGQRLNIGSNARVYLG